MELHKLLHKSKQELFRSGIKTADLDVKVLLRHTLEQDDVFLISHPEALITNAQYQKFRRLIRRRKKGEPVGYLTGHKEFYGLDFIVNKNVLVPRPETETLVEKAIEFIKLKVYQVYKVDPRKQEPINQLSNQPISILDIGTGSGCIIVSLAKNLFLPPFSPLQPTTYNLQPVLYASDICPKALKVAKVNAKKHDVYNNIQFYKSDLFENKKLPKKFDLIIANLPYLDPSRKDKVHEKPETMGLSFEPHHALYANNNGFELVERLVKLLPQKLAEDGIALLEIDETQNKILTELCKQTSLKVEPIENSTNWSGFFKISQH